MGNNNTSAVAKGAALLGISAIIVKIIGVIYKVPLSYVLGDEGMGYFNSAYTVYTLFFILSSAGIPKAISILVAKNEAEKQNSSYGILKICSLFFLGLGILICVLFYILAKPISNLIKNSGAVFAMYAIAPSLPILCLNGVLRGYLIGRMKFLSVALSELIAGASKLVFGLLLAHYAVKMGCSVSTVSAYTIFGLTIGAHLAMLPLCISICKNHGITGKISFIKTIGEVLKISLPITLSSSLAGITGVLDLTLIMRCMAQKGYSSDVATVIYGNYTTLALPMFTLVTTLIAQISTSLLPAITEGIKNGDLTGNREKIRFALLLSFLISIPAATYYFIYPREVLTILFEESSVVLGAPFLSSIAPSVLLIGPLTIANTVLEAKGKFITPVISLSVGSFIKIIVSYILIKHTEIGIIGASIGTFSSYLIPLIIAISILRRQSTYKGGFYDIIIIPSTSVTASVFIGHFLSKIAIFVNNERMRSLVFLATVGAIYLILSAILLKRRAFTTNNCDNLYKRYDKGL